MWKKTKINLVFIDSEALPVTRQLTRSTKSLSSNAITCIPKQSRTVTYRCSLILFHTSVYMCCKWNVLPPELRTNPISLASLKCLLLQYYNEALHLYDTDDIKTWRTISSVPGQRCNDCSEDSPALALLLYFLPSLYFFPFYLLVALVISYTFHIIIIIIIIFNEVIG